MVIPVSRKYKRLTTYGFDLWGKPAHGYDKVTVYDLRLRTCGLRLTAYGLAPYSERQAVLKISADTCSEGRCTLSLAITSVDGPVTSKWVSVYQ